MGSVRASGRCICSPSHGGYHICALFGAEFPLKILKTDLKLMKNISGRHIVYAALGGGGLSKSTFKGQGRFFTTDRSWVTLGFFGWVGLGKL